MTGLLPTGPAGLTPENLQRVMADMGTGPGWYASADLYRWYASMCAEDGLQPISVRKFGGALAELGYQPSSRRVEGKPARGWFISRRATRGQRLPS